ncbi:glycosyltransferase family 2 protein [Massilia violaceinigra]|uniref:Glycosyltransferase family 2 protein n=1 Tax=Massilia violaceinigra TaxID=2045208 RepID=A0ABY4A4A1_9BURK|nr:glycosyltransferase family A protein [Massilia violaceinigra]UOD29613.1 glycosyltransferase family 2 protein [Massilia violaceinigra]
MIGIVVPAHNEEVLLGACLDALIAAAAHPALLGEAVEIVVVLDDCDDGSAAVVAQRAAGAGCTITAIALTCRQVGTARATGARHLLAANARWLAFTDADTRVTADWLVQQLALDVDVVCGTVAVDDWSAHAAHAAQLQAHFKRTYHDRDGHHHIHGANLGVSAAAYRSAGGFEPVDCHEDVLLVAALQRSNARFAWSAAPRVVTSARTDARARGGFGDTMVAIVASDFARPA